MRTVVIEPMLNGFLVTVGCKKLVFTDINQLCEELKNYQANPTSVEKFYLDNALNKNLDEPQCTEAEEPQRIERNRVTGMGRGPR